MSKVDAQRAMREARYARNNASGPTRREAAAQGTSTTPFAPTPETRPAKAAKAAKAAPQVTAAPQGELCGHKSMNGRACTREAGHPEKNHRYG
ncbi:MAG: hypothetical protein ACRYG2_27875 [Janthinobacterium lividum]